MERAPIAEPKPIMRLGRDEYVGLHRRYATVLGGSSSQVTTAREDDDQLSQIRKQLSTLFEGMMKTLYDEQGAQFRIEILSTPEVQDFIGAHAAALDSSFAKVSMSDAMRSRLQRSDYIFSGIKTFHELNEAFPSLVDENGNRKPFERFLDDVRKIDRTYNQNYLRSEYNFCQASAEMAAKWEQFAEDGDRYNLQYRTANDGKVRPEHAALHGVTLPITDPFWETYYPPNGWNCRCTVVQVRKSKYPQTPHDEAMQLGELATGDDKKGFFHFNPGIQQKTFPDYNPYTIKRCRDCDIAKGKANLAKPMDNELCTACKLVRECWRNKKNDKKETFIACPTEKGKLRVSSLHGKNEKKENVRVGSFLANKHGYEIDLIANPSDKKSPDSYNKTLGVYQEYKVSKAPTKNSIDSLIRAAAKQADHIVLMADSETPLGILADAIKSRVRRTKVESLTLIVGDKDVIYTRSQMVSNDFKIRQADLK